MIRFGIIFLFTSFYRYIFVNSVYSFRVSIESVTSRWALQGFKYNDGGRISGARSCRCTPANLSLSMECMYLMNMLPDLRPLVRQPSSFPMHWQA